MLFKNTIKSFKRSLPFMAYLLWTMILLLSVLLLKHSWTEMVLNIYVCSASYHPSTNGLVERAVQIFKHSLQQIPGGSVKEKLANFLFKYRITPHSSTGVILAEPPMGIHLKIVTDKCSSFASFKVFIDSTISPIHKWPGR